MKTKKKPYDFSVRLCTGEPIRLSNYTILTLYTK
nr:MAG TPA: hypothetical protein [Caudoviricetes sp.]